MIRNLKVLIAAAMALAAFGAFNASGAQAAEFHCSVEPCTATLLPDGTGKTAHHVFIVKKEGKSASVTCNSISGAATANKETEKTLTFTNIVYSGCTLAGSEATVEMKGCDYKFSAEKTVTVECPGGGAITIKAGSCEITVGAQGPLGGLTYNNNAAKSEVTAETNIKNIHAFVHTNCTPLLTFDGTITEAEYTTGNTIVTGETHPGGGMANVWWE